LHSFYHYYVNKTIPAGTVNLLFNNAGVAHSQLSWEHTIDDWNWILGVNLWSIVYAHRYFIPRLIKQSDNSHIINTASAAGLISAPGMNIRLII
jgi:NADP-dependent 3-hydroxy acid dehydrogenase YdfG